jgi:nucleotide sugar dehydrogenase
LREIYARPLAEGTPFLVTDFATAELVKVAANAFLATRISFINAMSEVCDVAEADVTVLAAALGHDARIGSASLRPGLGFGGGCLPKDIRAFMARADDLGVGQSLAFLGEVDAINERCRSRTVGLARELVGGSFDGRRVGCSGRRSSRTATTSGTRQPSTWRQRSTGSAPRSPSTIRRPWTTPAASIRTSSTPTPRSRRHATPT